MALDSFVRSDVLTERCAGLNTKSSRKKAQNAQNRPVLRLLRFFAAIDGVRIVAHAIYGAVIPGRVTLPRNPSILGLGMSRALLPGLVQGGIKLGYFGVLCRRVPTCCIADFQSADR